MKNERFVIRAYGKSELAMLYFPKSSKATALRMLNKWLKFSPRLRKLPNPKFRYYTPLQVKLILDELGEPFDIE